MHYLNLERFTVYEFQKPNFTKNISEYFKYCFTFLSICENINVIKLFIKSEMFYLFILHILKSISMHEKNKKMNRNQI